MASGPGGGLGRVFVCRIKGGARGRLRLSWLGLGLLRLQWRRGRGGGRSVGGMRGGFESGNG